MFVELPLALFESSAWSNMFLLDPDKVYYLERIIRPMIVYFFLIIAFRVLGHRELAQLNPMDLVVLLLLSNTVQNAIIGNDTSLTGGIIGAVALLGINYAVVLLKFKSRRFEKFIEGVSRVLVKDGEIDEKALRRELLTKDDMHVLAHEKDLRSADDIENCVFHQNGTLYVERKEYVGSTDGTDDEDFKEVVLKKIDKLTEQLSDLQNLLQKS